MEDTLHALDMTNAVHRVCLFLVFQPQIQQSLDCTRSAWNLHKILSEKNQNLVLLYKLSKQDAIHRGYWHGDPGDSVHDASLPNYGYDPQAPIPPANELTNDPNDGDLERADPQTYVNDDEEILSARNVLEGFDLERDDGNWGIDMWFEAVQNVYEYWVCKGDEA